MKRRKQRFLSLLLCFAFLFSHTGIIFAVDEEGIEAFSEAACTECDAEDCDGAHDGLEDADKDAYGKPYYQLSEALYDFLQLRSEYVLSVR